VADKRQIAKLFRMLSTSGNERRNAFAALERAMQREGVSWSDIGNAVERDDGKYTEVEMQEYAQAARAEGVDAGIKIGMTRASNGNGNGHMSLPMPAEMAQYCHERRGRLRNDRERDFIGETYMGTQRGKRLSLRQLGYLASLYIQAGGKV
jgi:hypothetical protein